MSIFKLYYTEVICNDIGRNFCNIEKRYIRLCVKTNKKNVIDLNKWKSISQTSPTDLIKNFGNEKEKKDWAYTWNEWKRCARKKGLITYWIYCENITMKRGISPRQTKCHSNKPWLRLNWSQQTAVSELKYNYNFSFRLYGSSIGKVLKYTRNVRNTANKDIRYLLWYNDCIYHGARIRIGNLNCRHNKIELKSI